MENIIYLKNYKALDWAVKHVDITFDLHKENTKVYAQLHMELQEDSQAPIQLSG